jgi:hypothetical protein
MCGDGGAGRARREARRQQEQLRKDMIKAEDQARSDAKVATERAAKQSEDYQKSLLAMQASQPKFVPAPEQVNTTQASAGRSPIKKKRGVKTRLSDMRIKLNPTVNTSAGGKTGSNIG